MEPETRAPQYSSVQAVTAAMAVMDMMTALKLPTHMDGFLYPLGELGADRDPEHLLLRSPTSHRKQWSLQLRQQTKNYHRQLS